MSNVAPPSQPAIPEQPPSADADEPALPPPASYTLTLILAAVLWAFDTQMAGVPMASLFVLTIGNFILIVGVLIACFRRNWPVALRRLASIGIYSAVCFVAILQTKADGRRVRQNAEKVIAACEQYHAREGRYPEQLAQLVPRDLPALPPARLGAMGSPQFRYFVTAPGTYLKIGPGVHILEYTAFPPYGKAFYAFEKKQWSFRD